MNVVIAAGGTAGHVNPAVALARALFSETVTFIGTERGLEASVVPGAGFEMDAIEIVGFDRAKPARLPLVGAKAIAAIGAARKLLTERRADVVVGMGGYVSLPVCLAARSRSIPVVLHEQNIVLGLAHKVSKPFARRLAVSFEETLSSAGPRGVYTGNPVLPEIAGIDRASLRKTAYSALGLDPQRRTVLIFGGSLGARTLNEAAPALARRWAARDDIQILHISGRSDATQSESSQSDATQSGDTAVGGAYHRLGYTDQMAAVYAVADIGICRGGATTVAELGAVGLPAVIVPYPHHRDRQQERHGAIVAAAGAGVVVPDAEATADRLGAEVERLLEGRRLEEMAEAARRLGRPDAAAHLAALVREMA